MNRVLSGARLAVFVTAAASLFMAGCGGNEVFVTGGSGGTTTATGGQGGKTGGGGSGGGGTTNPGGGGTGGTTNPGGGGTGGTTNPGGGGAGGATVTAECQAAADCDAVKGGPAACGSWACNMGTCEASSPGCTDGDGDGYGAGANCACAGIDCNDADAQVQATDSTSCYTGPAGTLNVGACHPGVTTCNAGVWSPCGGQVTPSGEACNTQDDDCNGMVDDALGVFSCGLGACTATVAACTNGVPGVCKPGAAAAVNDAMCDGVDNDCDGPVDEDCGCVAVNFASVSASPDGTALNPFPAVQAAIDWAAAHPNGPQTVCVAAGATCGMSHTYTSKANQTVTMANGVSVLGNYESLTWTRCNNSTTILQPQTAQGVTFPNTITKTTALDGVKVDRFQATTTSGVTVDGGKGALLSNVTINNAPSVTSSYAVNVINGGDATITGSRLDAGAGTSESIGVRSVSAKVTLKNNCSNIDPVTGHCQAGCFNNGTQQPSIVGRATGTGTTFAVLLDKSAGSKIETSALCRTQADIGAVIRVTGDATGVEIRSNTVNGFGGVQQAYGIWLDDCNDAAPWIVDNEQITTQGANGNTVVNAVRAMGACHPVIDNNKQIIGGSEGQAHNPIGVYCGLQNGVASKCVVLSNGAIKGSGACFPPTSIGVRCDDGGCNRIANNRLITGRGAAMDSVGVWLGSTGTSVENNQIQGGCAGTQGNPGVSTGVRTDDAYARLENNRIYGYLGTDCNCGAGSNGNPSASHGLRVFLKGGAHEVDVHSNDIDAGGPPPGGIAACNGRGILVDLVAGAVLAKQGIFRNNIVRAGSCMTSRYNFVEALGGADPRIVESNDFDPAGTPTALYFDESVNAILAVSGVNLLADITVSGNISADPLFVSYPTDVHIQAGSPCANAGTAVGAPVVDMDGKVRDATPDIGADEL